MDWQKIESAPRDGSRVLLFCLGIGHVIGWWDIDEEMWRDSLVSYGATHPEPLRWMPLPEPPK